MFKDRHASSRTRRLLRRIGFVAALVVGFVVIVGFTDADDVVEGRVQQLTSSAERSVERSERSLERRMRQVERKLDRLVDCPCADRDR